MTDDTLLLLRGGEVADLLQELGDEVVQAVRAAYLAHHAGRTSLPHSTFLRFPDQPANRIIALPAFLEDEAGPVAGMKWIASFPGNVAAGRDRASAVLILNSMETGFPLAILEGSLISAARTAASAALAAQCLHPAGDDGPVGIVGCGVINFEVVRRLAQLLGPAPLVVHDLDGDRAARFAARCEQELGAPRAAVAADVGEVLDRTRLVSLATTATVPHLDDFAAFRPGTTLLHVSLRDLSPSVVLRCDNVVDDVDHVFRSNTSLHLAEQQVGHRGFVRGTLAEVMTGRVSPRSRPEAVVAFSPFGLGILDLAVGRLVYDAARATGTGLVVDAFLPDGFRAPQPAAPV